MFNFFIEMLRNGKKVVNRQFPKPKSKEPYVCETYAESQKRKQTLAFKLKPKEKKN